MKRLVLVRHAKSSWDDPQLEDKLRPLNPRGRRVAPKIGHHLAQRGYLPDAVVHSDAVRARQTADSLVEALEQGAAERGLPGPERVATADLYLASVDDHLETIWSFSDAWSSVLLVGHNPGMHELIGELTGEPPPRFPTCAVAIIDVSAGVDSGTSLGANTLGPTNPASETPEPWAMVQPSLGRLHQLWLPKALGF